MKRFKIITLGCRTNQYESAVFCSQLEALGLVEAKKGEEADLCIVNSCAVTASAGASSKRAIRKLLKENDKASFFVTGCLIEGDQEDVISIDKRVTLVPNMEKETLIKIMFPECTVPFALSKFSGNTRAFVKIQDGCNSYCSYCIIPFTRGRSRSRSKQEVLSEIHSLVASGYKEIVLTGINIGDFDGLPTLVQEMDKIEGLERIRLSSIDPNAIDEDLLSVILTGKKCCPSMHISLQSGSDQILQLMGRSYSRSLFLEKVSALGTNKDFTITTDVIVGFPGETDEDFSQTLEMIKHVKFAKVHVFPYSHRPKTRASRMAEVSQEIVTLRKEELLKTAEKVAFDLRNSYLERTVPVLFEGRAKKGYLMGHTSNFLPVFVPSQTVVKNELVNIKLIENTHEALFGKRE